MKVLFFVIALIVIFVIVCLKFVKNKYLKIIACVGGLLGILIAVVLNFGIINKSFLQHEKCFTLITDMRLKTVRNDGGSNTSQYYIIDFEDKVATKYEDCYIGFKGYKYQKKYLNSKKLNKGEIEALKKLIKKVEEKKHEKMNFEESNYFYYSLKLQDGETIQFNDYTIINEMEEILKES